MQPCGTPAAYTRHYANGEKACDDCRAAWAAYKRAAYRRGRDIVKVPEVVVDVLTTFDRWMTTDVVTEHVIRIHPEWKPRSVARALMRLKDRGLVQWRPVDRSFHPGGGRSVYVTLEWRADDSAWEALNVVA